MFCLNKKQLTINDIEKAANFGGQDVFLLVPFLSEELYYKVLIPKICNHNESLYTKWFFTGKNSLQEKELATCQYSIVPFKFNIEDQRINTLCENAENHNKTVLAFFTDDTTETFNLPNNLLLFRTSVNKSTIQTNERVMPALHPDHFSGFTEHKNSISFCGQLTPLRHSIVTKLNELKVPTDFIYRKGFWAPEVESKIKARKEYYKNLLSSKYALCMRGSGNFSFRFYEALCFGRIPILIDTDTVLPFSSIIDWNKYIIFLKQEDIHTLPNILEKDDRSMADNRKLWEDYFSIEGYAQKFIKDI
jgi:hypothetical protein